jgi:hypothetical protein
VYEAARRRSLTAFVPLANATRDALAVVTAIATQHTYEHLRSLDVHFNSAVGFLCSLIDNHTRPMAHVGMIARMGNPDELHAIWNALSPDSSCLLPPNNHMRDRTDPAYAECLGMGCRVEHEEVPRELMQHFSLALQDAPESLLERIAELYANDMMCYNASSRAVAELGPLLPPDGGDAVPFTFA